MSARQDLCEQRYRESKHPCHGCPIISECHGGTGILTWDTLKAWQDRCEQAALKSIEEGKV